MYLFEMSCDCLGLNCISARCADYYSVRGEVLQKPLGQRSQTSWRHCCRHGDGGQRLENVQLERVGQYRTDLASQLKVLLTPSKHFDVLRLMREVCKYI